MSRFEGIDLTGVGYARDFELRTPEGQVRRLVDYQGKVVVLFFGYTQCPDVCPSTLGELKLAKQRLGAAGERVVGLFVTVDPERDTPAVLKDYIAHFGPGMEALWAPPEALPALAQEFKVFFAKVPRKGADGYSVDHTAASFLFDDKGRIRVYLPYGKPPQALDHDLQQLLKGG
ncbi:SCO family protein [Inhella gelatinilytica]|uniref:SCO family protein n=1 Tax=Inhella gelatinilytica TaxID=2795030 RepID=UPI0028736CE8|nr:SCO family protein [Inhella gelatinilytica]